MQTSPSVGDESRVHIGTCRREEDGLAWAAGTIRCNTPPGGEGMRGWGWEEEGEEECRGGKLSCVFPRMPVVVVVVVVL